MKHKLCFWILPSDYLPKTQVVKHQCVTPFFHCVKLLGKTDELLNIFQADSIGCQIITVTNDVLKKLSLVGKDLGEYSLETVKMFYNDAQQAGYTLD